MNKIDYVDIYKANEILGYNKLINELTKICQLNYNIWYDKYYQKYPNEYPNYQSLLKKYQKLLITPINTNIQNKYHNKLLIDTDYINCFIAIKNNNEIISIISVSINELPLPSTNSFINNNITYWLSDLITLPEYRGKGHANKLINISTNWIINSYHLDNPTHLYIVCEQYLIDMYINKYGFCINNHIIDNYWHLLSKNIINPHHNYNNCNDRNLLTK